MIYIDSYRFGSSGYAFPNLAFGFSLRKLKSWGNAVLKIKRSSDNAEAYVFFDGASAQSTITTSSYISTTSATTPDTTTLATWVGSDNATVTKWIAQLPSGVYDSAYEIGGASNLPDFISSGSIINENALPTVDFTSTLKTLVNASGFSEMDDGNDFTIATVSTNDASANVGTIINTSNTGTNRFLIQHDRRTTGGNYILSAIITTGGTYRADLTTADGTATQRSYIVTADGTSKEMKGYRDGTLNDTVTWTSTYDNGYVRVGSNKSNATPLNGNIQEILVFTDKKAGGDITDLDDNIRTYYGF